MTAVRSGRRRTTGLLAAALALTLAWSPAVPVEVAPRTTGALAGLLEDASAPVAATVASVVDGLPSVTDGPLGEALRAAGWSGTGAVPVLPSSAVAFELPEGLDAIWVRAAGPVDPLPWTRLALVDPEDGPDGVAAEARRVTELAWVRAADEIEVLAPAGAALDEVRVHLIDTLGLRAAEAAGEDLVDHVLEALHGPLDTTDEAIAGLVPSVPSLDPEPEPEPTASPSPRARPASSARPPMFRRADWGAAPARSRHSTARPRAVVVHHTATRSDYTKRESPAIVRAIQHHHQRSLGWSDVGYNALIDRYGQLFEGRAGGIEAGVVGAHARGYNTGSYGVALIGNYEDAKPTRSMLDRLADVTAWQSRVHGIDLRSGARATVGGRSIPTFVGHRDVGQTACPGRNVVRKMPEVRRAAAAARR